MGLYNKYILPEVINWTCKQKPNRRQREKIIPYKFFVKRSSMLPIKSKRMKGKISS